MEKEKYKFICEPCNFTCNYNSGWLEHIATQKHIRNGERKIHKCQYNNCDYQTHIFWNMKMHQITSHSTKEEREQYKYYCLDCDKVYFSPLYYNKHIAGIKHNNQVKINKIQDPKINL